MTRHYTASKPWDYWRDRQAVVDEITARNGVRFVTAVCPNGTRVRHGAGPTSLPIELCLGSRAAHCTCCAAYVLVLEST